MPAPNRERVLDFLHAAPPGSLVPSRLIGESLGLSDAMTARVLKDLREEGLVESRPVLKDRRGGHYKAGGPMAPLGYRIRPEPRKKSRSHPA